MIDRLSIEYFKCFKSISLPLSRISLFTGFNAAGKSSALQVLLLLAQSLRSNHRKPEFALNGPLTQLGTPGDILNSESSTTSFKVENDFGCVGWTLSANDTRGTHSMSVSEIEISGKDYNGRFDKISELHSLIPVPHMPKCIESMIFGLSGLVFLSVNRTNLSDAYKIPDSVDPTHADVGCLGEYAPWLFYKNSDEIVPENRRHPNEKSPVLRRQLNAWANDFFPGAEANALRVEKTNLMSLEFRIGSTSEWCRPSNIGYGLSYVFPVLIAGLLAQPGQILVIDSPESHLHPQGQSKMGCFLATVAASGVQVVVETHSDHLLNGLRKSVIDKQISPSDAAIHFFGQPLQSQMNNVVSPSIDGKGNLSDWPKGFFDQLENDLAYLSGWK